jgi:DNA-directed RNA polymerase subunit RPC12/RpoP
MKKGTTLRRLIIGCSLAAALMLATAGTAQAQEKGSAKGGASLLLKPIKTTQDIEALQPGDAVVMSCPKCKTVTVSYVETTKGHIKDDKVKQEHLCPGCESKIAMKGVGKGAKGEITHVCKKCGSEEVMCCVLKKGSGPTKGMEEKR